MNTDTQIYTCMHTHVHTHKHTHTRTHAHTHTHTHTVSSCRYTEHTVVSLAQQWDQLGQMVMRMQHNLEQQIQAR